jgi:NAD(P)-dependent dehydrogenase (short-subunit alcohol dehydrogenase family)
MEIKERTVIVTGSGSGNGRALAIEFARNRAKVVCCARRKNKLDETVAIIMDDGGQAIAIPTDITEHSQVTKMIAIANDEFGAIDIVFNNAGSFQSIAGIDKNCGPTQ